MTKISYHWFLQDRRQKEKDLQYGRIHLLCCKKECQGTRASEQRIPRFWEKKADGEALHNIIRKLSEERNLTDLHLKHYHMSTAQFKNITTHLDIPGKILTLSTCGEDVPVLQFRETETGKIPRERTSGRRTWRPHLSLYHGLATIGDNTFGCLIVLDEATSHLTAYPCKSTSPSEVISMLHEWMDTFQMNPKAMCADMAFHHPHDMQAFYRMHNVKRTPTGPHTPWFNRTEMGVRLFKKFLLALVDTASQKPGSDHFGTNHSCLVDAQGSNGEKYTGALKW